MAYMNTDDFGGLDDEDIADILGQGHKKSKRVPFHPAMNEGLADDIDGDGDEDGDSDFGGDDDGD